MVKATVDPSIPMLALVCFEGGCVVISSPATNVAIQAGKCHTYPLQLPHFRSRSGHCRFLLPLQRFRSRLGSRRRFPLLPHFRSRSTHHHFPLLQHFRSPSLLQCFRSLSLLQRFRRERKNGVHGKRRDADDRGVMRMMMYLPNVMVRRIVSLGFYKRE